MIDTSNLRVLAVIASYGTKNLPYLQRVIRNLRAFRSKVDIVVVSEGPKDLGAGVILKVGLPSRNPWSLPFAHQQVFAENLAKYDLFIYSEDDIDFQERHVEAFLEASNVCADDELPGFMRFEIAPDGSSFMPDVHGSFHWRPNSVVSRGSFLFAQYTNEHAGFYIVRREHLQKAIQSGSFPQKPREGRYGLPETAATDIYTCCGFKKLVCVSHLDKFLVHHMPNRYVGVLGLKFGEFQNQISALNEIAASKRPDYMLCDNEPKVHERKWSKRYDEDVGDVVRPLFPKNASSILTIGCGLPLLEERLQSSGAKLTTVPLDSVTAIHAEIRGIEVVFENIATLDLLRGRQFDLIIVSHLLHLLPDPAGTLANITQLVCSGGKLIVTGYNFSFLPHSLRRHLGVDGYAALKSPQHSGIHLVGPADCLKVGRIKGFRNGSASWFDAPGLSGLPTQTEHPLLSRFYKRWIVALEK